MEVKKIIILGDSESGKTTVLNHICSNMVKTTALDYGKIIINGKKVHFFCSSGHKRFKFMQEVLCQNINGAIIVIDSIKGISETDEEIINFVNKKEAPYVIFSNKQDLDGKIQIDKDNVPVIPTIATTGHGINKGLNILLELIEKNELFENIQITCTF